MIHNIEKPMLNYHCRESDNAWHSDWVLNPKNKKCYLIGRSSVIDGSGLWLNATAARIGSYFYRVNGIRTKCELKKGILYR